MQSAKTRLRRIEQVWNTKPAIRLAVGYGLILLAISLIFSVVLYHFAKGELARGLTHQFTQFGGDADNYPGGPGSLPPAVQTNLDDAQHGLWLNLIYFNVIIVTVGAFLSYWLAKRTMKPIEAALEAQRRFASDASHELRTPLAVMQTEIEIARADPELDLPEAVELLDSNLAEVKKLHKLSDNLLRLARSEGRTLTPTVVSLSAIATEAADHMSTHARSKRIDLINDTVDIKIMGDHDSLVELAAILLDNAIKYSPKSSVITLITKRTGHSGWLTITDTGSGIPATDLPHIFDRFYRADKSRTGGETSGHGLGLSLAKHIADLNNAEIVATSQFGKGSSFSIKARLANPR